MTRPVLHQGHSPHGCHQETRFFIAVAVNNAVSPVDARPPRVQCVGVPATLSPEWKQYVKTHLKNGNGVLFMPYALGDTVRDFDVTTRWMLNTVFDDIPMINGYSGFFPTSHFRLQKAIEANPYSDETLGLLHDGKIQFLVVSSHAAMKAVAARDRKFGLRLVFEDPQGTQILELLHQVE